MYVWDLGKHPTWSRVSFLVYMYCSNIFFKCYYSDFTNSSYSVHVVHAFKVVKLMVITFFKINAYADSSIPHSCQLSKIVKRDNSLRA